MISYEPLFETMRKKKITSYQLAKMGFARSTYYSIQQGNSISTNTLNQLCKLLQCTVSDILEYKDEEN
ncbi:MAG: helix-turn-helix domain-containing protein [Lachnospiraceae bacterium]|nr:helix-turn-helix domain-containing protein [Lachnospiraceae bacterium]